ncbi:hypothetical protein WA588_000659 [Blastocystis sp. NMH]
MSQVNSGAGFNGLLRNGYKSFSGTQDAVIRNIDACRELCAIHRTSLGPNGMSKLVVNQLDKIFITSDTATIVKEMEVVHPAAKLLVEAAQKQEQEMGDGTNFVVTFAGELLAKAEELIMLGVHVNDIITGYEKAYEVANKALDDLATIKVADMRDVDAVTSALLPVVAAKQYGHEDVLARAIAEACLYTFSEAPAAPKLDVDNIRTVRLLGGSIDQSRMMGGMVLPNLPANDVLHVSPARVLILTCGLEASSSETKGTVLIRSAEELTRFTRGEEQSFGDEIAAIAHTGVNVIFAGGSISEIARHYLSRENMMGVSVGSKFDLRRLAKTAGATALVRVGPPTAEEIGECSAVNVEEVGGKKVLVVEKMAGRVATVVLRGATESLLEDCERTVDETVNTVKTLCGDPRLVPGAGAAEMAMAAKVAGFGGKVGGLEQYAVRKFAEALEVFPRTLAENAGQDAVRTVSLLRERWMSDVKCGVGVDIEGGDVCDVMGERPVLDVFATKKNAMRLAVSAALTILKVDQIIMAKEAGGPKLRAPQKDVE